MGRKIVIMLTLALSMSANSADLKSVYSIIKHVETDNVVDAVGDGGRAYGVVQIHKICVDDINRIYGTSYTHGEAFNPACAEEMFMLYVKAGILRFKRRYGRLPSEYEIARMWNGGIYTGYRRRTTLDYMNRYIKYKIKLNK